MRPQRARIAVRGLREEVAGGFRREAHEPLAQRTIHPGLHGHELLVAPEAQILGEHGVLQRREFRGVGRDLHGRERRVARLLETQRRVRPCEFTTENRDFLVPRERYEQHVAQIPRVLLLADPRWTGALGGLRLEPGLELRGGVGRLTDRGGERRFLRMPLAHACEQCAQGVVLFVEGTHATHPQVPRVGVGEVGARLGEEWGDRAQRRRKLLHLVAGEITHGIERGARPDAEAPEADGPVDGGPLLCGRVALVGPNGGVIGRIARERLQDGEVIQHAVHLGAHQVPVHLLTDRPARGIDGGEALLERPQLSESSCVGGRRVIRCPLHAWRLLEGAPGGEQREQLSVAGCCR